MTLEQILTLFFAVAIFLALVTITLLVVDAYFASGKFKKRFRQKRMRLKYHAPSARRHVSRGGKRRAIPAVAVYGVIGGLLAGVAVASRPFFEGGKGGFGVSKKRRSTRDRGIRVFRF